MDRGLNWVLRLVVGLFAFLTLWTGFWTAIAGPGLLLHPKNPRLHRAEKLIHRGGIYTRDGKSLAVTKMSDHGFVREFVGPVSFAHTVGYNDARYGKAGIEAAFDKELLGLLEGTGFSRLVTRAVGRTWVGWDVVTTLDLTLQEAADAALAGRRGAVVVLDPADGSVLAMVSSPGFDPRRLESALGDDGGKAGAFFNRATQGQYPPGSAFKPAVLAAALEENAVHPDHLFKDEGYVVVDGRRIQNAGAVAHGRLALDDALAVSSNAAFATFALQVGARSLYDFGSALGFGGLPELKVEVAAGHLPTVDTLADKVSLAVTGIGQGELLVTPLQMAVMAASVANGGWRTHPRIVRVLRSPGGRERLLPVTRPERVMSPGTAHIVREAMIAVVDRGTGAGARVDEMTVAGKTGTAENPHGRPHAWFIGFAPARSPRIALAVVVENGGGGGAVAAPIAREVFTAMQRTHGRRD